MTTGSSFSLCETVLFSSYYEVSRTSFCDDLTLKLFNCRSSGDYTSWVDKFDEIGHLEQDIKTIEVNLDESHGHSSIEMFVELSSHLGQQVETLIIQKAEFRNAIDFRDIMRNFPMLKQLEIHRTTFKWPENEENQTIHPVNMKHLDTIKVVYSSWSFFQYLVGTQITSLIASTAQVRPSERDNLINFLEASERLESVEMDREGFERIFQTNFTRPFPFKLKKFKYFSYTFKSEVNQLDENFISFLETQAASLEDLQLEYSSREILQEIFTKLVNLRKLKLNANSLPMDKEFYDQLKPFKYLKEFDADDRIPNEDAARGILKNCPNLEILIVECDPNDVISEIFPFIAAHNPKLRVLRIDSLKAQYKPEVRFKRLEVLHVFLFKDDVMLVSFLRNNPTVTTLKIKWVYEQEFIEVTLHELLSKTNVQHLIIGGKQDTMKAVYEKVKTDRKNLKTLELSFKTDNGVMQTSKFDFTDDPPAWNARHEDYEKLFDKIAGLEYKF